LKELIRQQENLPAIAYIQISEIIALSKENWAIIKA